MDENIKSIADKHGLTPERLNKVSAELYGILAAYDPRELQAMTELIQSGISPRSNQRDKGANR